MKKIYLLGIALSFNIMVAHSSEFCVATTFQFQLALNEAASNGQSDVIRITEGTITAPVGGFVYHGQAESFDIEISGGWSEFFGNPCGQQLSGSPFLTLLDGNTLDRVLAINVAATGNITISSLLFANGLVSGSGARGGGLNIFSPKGYNGNILIEQNAFLNNGAQFAGALNIGGGELLIVRNNLFAGNHATSSTSIGLVQNNATAVYVTNNTIVSNTTSGLRVWVSGSSVAFIANNVFWDNVNQDLIVDGDGYKMLFNNDIGVQLGAVDEQAGNISLPPLFETGLFNYTPALNSPLRNTGLMPSLGDSWSLGDSDIIGNLRVVETEVDMGAYEVPLPPDLIFANGFEPIVRNVVVYHE